MHEELLKFESVTLLPHIGTATVEARSQMFVRTKRRGGLTSACFNQSPSSPSSVFVVVVVKQNLQLESAETFLDGKIPENAVNKEAYRS